MRLFLGMLLLIFTIGCNSGGTANNDAWGKTTKLKVLTTLVPYYCIVHQIGGEDVEAKCLLINTGPHDYAPNREDARLLAKADMLVVNGLLLEEFLDNMIREANNKALRIVYAGDAIPKESLLQAEGKPHYHGDKLVSHKGTDPHVWLGVDEMKAMAKKIAAELINRDGAHKAGYESRLAKVLQKLDDLGAVAKTVTKDSKLNPSMVSFHDSFRYWGRSCGVNIAGTIRDLKGTSVSAAKLHEQAMEFRKEKVQIVTREPQYPSEIAASLAKEIDPANCRMIELDPIETGPETSSYQSDPEHYFTVMKKNFETIRKALQQ